MQGPVDRAADATKVQVYVDRDVWRRFRGLCMERGASTHREIETLLVEYIAAHRGGGQAQRAS